MVDFKSFTKAADALYISHSTVSRTVTALEEELAALDAICSEKKMTRSAFLRSCVEKVQGGDVEPTYVVTRNADAERMASEAKSIGVT